MLECVKKVEGGDRHAFKIGFAGIQTKNVLLFFVFFCLFFQLQFNCSKGQCVSHSIPLDIHWLDSNSNTFIIVLWSGYHVIVLFWYFYFSRTTYLESNQS
eukprot:m.23034 g.23034  ORF g.23034 m.23034 type:complete len:100 (-) comp5509_c0_seq1:1054-1353(-)